MFQDLESCWMRPGEWVGAGLWLPLRKGSHTRAGKGREEPRLDTSRAQLRAGVRGSEMTGALSAPGQRRKGWAKVEQRGQDAQMTMNQ